jgi:hypothetical protein
MVYKIFKIVIISIFALWIFFFIIFGGPCHVLKISRIKPGMSKTQVISKVGQPDEIYKIVSSGINLNGNGWKYDELYEHQGWIIKRSIPKQTEKVMIYTSGVLCIVVCIDSNGIVIDVIKGGT